MSSQTVSTSFPLLARQPFAIATSAISVFTKTAHHVQLPSWEITKSLPLQQMLQLLSSLSYSLNTPVYVLTTKSTGERVVHKRQNMKLYPQLVASYKAKKKVWVCNIWSSQTLWNSVWAEWSTLANVLSQKNLITKIPWPSFMTASPSFFLVHYSQREVVISFSQMDMGHPSHS